MNRCLVIIVCLSASACARVVERSDPEFNAVAQSAIRAIEATRYETQRESRLIYVLPTSMDTRARLSLSSFRKVVAPEAVPSSQEVSLPAGYFAVAAFQVSGDTAIFAGTKGPIYVDNPLSCGSGISIRFHRVNGAWAAGESVSRLC